MDYKFMYSVGWCMSDVLIIIYRERDARKSGHDLCKEFPGSIQFEANRCRPCAALYTANPHAREITP
jgi:hypothetical protein